MSGSPINYSLQNTFDPFDAVSQGRAQGIQFRQSAEKRQRTTEMQSKLAGYANQDGGVTVEDIERMQTEYPEMGDHFDKTYERLDQEQKQSSINTMLPVHSMLKEGRNEDAIEMLEQIKEGNINSGDQDGANAVDAQIKLIQTNPKAASLSMSMALSSLMPTGEFRKLTEKKVKADFFTNTETGEVSALGINPETGEKVFEKNFPGVRRSSSLTPEEKGKAAAAVTTEKNKAALPFIEEKERRAVIRSPEYIGVVTAEKTIGDAAKLLESNPDIYKNIVGKTLGVGEAAKFNTQMQTGIRLFVQSISGKVVTDSEAEAFQKAYNPQFFNSPEIAQYKLETLSTLLALSKRMKLYPNDEALKQSMQSIIRQEGAGGSGDQSADSGQDSDPLGLGL